jgi:hypothetical protein
MKRWLSIVTAASLAGCGGANVGVEVERDASATQGESLSGLEVARSVRLPIADIRFHVAGKDAVSEDEGRWHTLVPENREVDLLALPLEGSVFLGDVRLPAGKITQIRLRLAAPEGVGEKRVLTGAVTEVDGTVCDLIVPASAWDPGLKLVHPFKYIAVDPANRVDLVLAFGLKEATRSSEAGRCVWRLQPTLKLKKAEMEPGSQRHDPAA